MKLLSVLQIAALGALGCTNSNELKPIDSEKNGLKTGIFGGSNSENNSGASGAAGEIHSHHDVTVLEHIPGQRYSYMKVKENEDEYWIATMKGDFKENESYHYHEGIEKTDYSSTELSRTFDRIVLVSELLSPDAHEGQNNASMQPNEIKIDKSEKITIPKSSTPIKDIISQPARFKNKTIEITGRVTKVNLGIMDRNWIHIYDGTNGNFDFVCTSKQDIPVGHLITLKGTVVLNKDFGAGYTYEILMENAQVK